MTIPHAEPHNTPVEPDPLSALTQKEFDELLNALKDPNYKPFSISDASDEEFYAVLQEFAERIRNISRFGE